MRFDSYVMSQAMSGMEPLIANPDMDEAMKGYRDETVTTEEAVNGTFAFFGTFAQAAPRSRQPRRGRNRSNGRSEN